MTESPMLTEIEYGPHKATVRESFDDVRKLIEDNWGAERPFAVTNAAGGGRRLIRPQHIHSITEVPCSSSHRRRADERRSQRSDEGTAQGNAPIR